MNSPRVPAEHSSKVLNEDFQKMVFKGGHEEQCLNWEVMSL